MAAGWFKREHSRASDADDVDARLARQAKRSGRTVWEEQEAILREVLPNVRRSVAHAGLTMIEYLDLNRVEYQDLLEANPGARSLVGRRSGLIDYAAFARLRRWIHEAAARNGEDIETWLARTGTVATPRRWERRTSAAPPDADERPPVDDALLDRLERLAALRESGALTDEEFQTQKRRVLGGG